MRTHAHTSALRRAVRICRSRLTGDFVQLPNRTVRDDRLSWMARGILAELLSRPDGWDTTADDMWRASSQARNAPGESRRAVRAAFAELKAAGYLIAERVRLDGGRMGTALTVYDTPRTGVPPVGTPVRPGDMDVSAGHADIPPSGTSVPPGQTPVSAGRTDVPTGGTPKEENRDRKQKENSLSSLSSNGTVVGGKDEREARDRTKSQDLTSTLADAFGATPDEVTAVLDAARRDGVRWPARWAGSEIGQADFADRLAELRRASTPAAAPLGCGRCAGGWVGDADRPAPCPTCKPHLSHAAS